MRGLLTGRCLSVVVEEGSFWAHRRCITSTTTHVNMPLIRPALDSFHLGTGSHAATRHIKKSNEWRRAAKESGKEENKNAGILEDFLQRLAPEAGGTMGARGPQRNR